MLAQILVYAKLLNIVDHAIICMFVLSMMLSVRLGFRKEVTFLILMALPAAAAAFIPTELLEEYLAEALVNKNVIKMAAHGTVYTIFMFISIIIKKSLEREHFVTNRLISWDSFGGLIFGFVRGYVILSFLMIAHAHFFPRPIPLFAESLIVRSTKSHLIDFNGSFEELLKHTDKEAAEIKKRMNGETEDDEKIDGDGTLAEYPIRDIDADELNPDIETE